MTQLRRHSALETCLNTASGFALSFGATFIVYPVLGMKTDLKQNLLTTVAFTAISIARGYFWRRFFNWLQWRQF